MMLSKFGPPVVCSNPCNASPINKIIAFWLGVHQRGGKATVLNHQPPIAAGEQAFAAAASASRPSD